jgi:hypothetical protein
MGGKNYIPSRDADFDAFFLNLNTYVEAQTSGTPPPAWSHIPVEVISALLAAYAAWHMAYQKTLAPHTPVDTLAKNNARKAAEGVLRPFVSQYLHYPPVTDEDRRAMAIPNHDTTPTPVPPPSTQVEADILLPGIHLIELKIKPASELAGLSATVRSGHGVRIYYGILGDVAATDKFRLTAPPASGDDLPHSVFTRKHKHQFDFPEEDRGKSVYFCLRYENSKGDAGPWGAVLQAIIP